MSKEPDEKSAESYAMDGFELGPSIPDMSALSSKGAGASSPALSADIILNPPSDLSVRFEND